MPRGGGRSSGGGGSSGGSSRTYVDNAYNRSAGRVGMAHGTAVISKSSSSGGGAWAGSSGGASSSYSSSAAKTYVDNSYNRSVGRVGFEHGTAVISKGSSSVGGVCGGSSGGSSSSVKTYVDNAYNRSKGRVGMEHGTVVISKGSSSGGNGTAVSKASSSTDNSTTSSSGPKRYVDNALNRKLGRVGMVHGTAVHSRDGKSQSPKFYKDNEFNRRKNRVGLQIGTAPDSRSESKTANKKTEKKTKAVKDAFDKMMGNEGGDMSNGMCDWAEYEDLPMGEQEDACEYAQELVNRLMEIKLWQEQSGQKSQPHTVIKPYSGQVIEFKELTLREKIGHGGFGDVYFGKWQHTVVAIKKLRVQRVSKKKHKQFSDEIDVFCKLEHPNIVKFLGACIETPNLCIVMEYMQMSLFDAIHVQSKDFTDDDRKTIICHSIAGLEYLHMKDIAHCDIKSRNILLDGVSDDTEDKIKAKITDFGLSVMKNENETTSTAFVSNIGTPRYSAPEVLRGDILSTDAMMKADVYSLSLIIYEVLYEDEPFSGLNYQQLVRQVGSESLTPEIDEKMKVKADVLEELKKCWSRDVGIRPTSKRLKETFDVMDAFYE